MTVFKHPQRELKNQQVIRFQKFQTDKMSRLASISATTLNQFALDFEGNYNRIVKSIQIAKNEFSKFRCGPELEIPGYSCQDHFYESDTVNHSWEVLAKLLENESCHQILIDVGMCIYFNGVTYNCRIICLNGKIIYIRPKMILCDDGNYRESRWFTGWSKKRHIEDFVLPEIIQKVTGQISVPFGDALLKLNDTCIGFEVCEELWNPNSTHIQQTLAGAEIIINASGSYTQIRKASYAWELITTASSKCCCCYVFSNLRGNDGERVYFDGCSTIVMNGNTLRHGKQYSLKDVEVLTAAFDLNEIRTSRVSFRSRTLEASKTDFYPKIKVDWNLESDLDLTPTKIIEKVLFNSPEEEIAQGPALWLWDYLRRCKANGFLLPLSGGVDSTSVAIIVYSMCDQIINFIKDPENPFANDVLKDLRAVVKDESYNPENAKELCNQLLSTCYMGSENSSEDTKRRAKLLAESIGSNHKEIVINSVINSFVEEASKTLGMTPKFNSSKQEDLSLQNIQARSRMVYAYFLAQLIPWTAGKNGFFLVLGTSNVDEAIRGYFTKYDCSSADLNPIGGISKTDLKSFILYAEEKFQLEIVREIVQAPPTAELKPLEVNQTDEIDMGMTYEELSHFGKLRKTHALGPFSMVAKLLHIWRDKHKPDVIADKVKYFYKAYAANRHKMTTLTPACHMENYSPEDHRFDLRPVFYPIDFTWQFRQIDDLVSQFNKRIGEDLD